MKLFPNDCKLNIQNYNEMNNVVQNWGFFSKEELEKNSNSLMMLDIDFGRKCSLKCPSCFRRNNKVDNNDYSDLSYEELIEVISDAKEVGLKNIKICGAGEPFENPLLLRFAQDMTSMNIGLSIFTKGHVLGDDNWVRRIYAHDKIYNAEELAHRLYELNTSVLISFQSFNSEIQDVIVGKIKGYTNLRDRAIKILIDVGFNKSIPTRLALCANPITKLNYSEIFDIYVYCRERNILPVNAALMISGKQIKTTFLKNHDVSNEEKENIFIKIYEYNIKNGIQSIEELQKDGISCMPGIHPCNQIASGLYLTSNGNVIRCPGDTSFPLGNIRKKSIVKIWNEHKNWGYKGKYNVKCPYKDGITLPVNIYENVLSQLIKNHIH